METSIKVVTVRLEIERFEQVLWCGVEPIICDVNERENESEGEQKVKGKEERRETEEKGQQS